jgi:diacylglycerol kinase (ATP)
MLKYIKREAPRLVSRTLLTWEGIKVTWKEEASFPQWVVANIISASLTFAFEMSPVERAIIIGFGLMVLVMELLNTAVEAAIDRISLEIHPLSKKAKDVACAAVGMMAATTGVVWLIIVVPKFM